MTSSRLGERLVELRCPFFLTESEALVSVKQAKSLVPVALAMFLLGWFVGVRSAAIPQAVAADAEVENEKIRDLLMSRHQALQHMLDEVRSRSPLMQGLFTDARTVRQMAHQAELELCTSHEQRRKVLTSIVETAKKEVAAKAERPVGVANGVVNVNNPPWHLLAQIDLLEAEIALEREKAK